MYYERTLSSVIKEASKNFKVILLTGPRQTGKSTLLERLSEPNRTRVTLDDTNILSLVKEDPDLFFEKYHPPLLIDEVQKAPEIFLRIKMIVDKYNKCGDFWLTGSQKFSLMQNVSDSLAGRVAVLDLQGLSQSEKQTDSKRGAFTPDLPLDTKRNSYTPSEMFSIIQKGSYPQLFSTNTPWELYYKSYIDTYLMRDINDISRISNELTFKNFLKILATRTGQLINYTDLSSDLGISPNTVKNWISILQTLNIIYILPPYFESNIGKRLIKAPKIYFMDTGLASYLCSIKDGNTLSESYLSGAFVETYAVSEIIKSYIHNGKTPNIYYLRTSNGHEIDLIIEDNGKAYPIEIKQTASPTLDMTKNFSLIPDNKRGKGAILSLTSTFMPMRRDVYSIPIAYI